MFHAIIAEVEAEDVAAAWERLLVEQASRETLLPEE